VDAIIRDLVDVAYRIVEAEQMRRVRPEAERLAQEHLVDLVAGTTPAEGLPAEPPWSLGAGSQPSSPEAIAAEQERQQRQQEQYEKVREYTRRRLEAGELEDQEVEMDVEDSSVQSLQIFSPTGMEEMGFNMQEMLGNLFPTQTTTRRTTVREARELLTEQEARKLIDGQAIASDAVDRAQQDGIVFLDELDKIAGRETGHGPDVSREGVQRDILPIVEGCTVMTKYGPTQTDHILFIAAGAFHITKPSDLIPEMQGRFPIRVELHSLNKEHFIRILEEPRNALIKQYIALLATEGVELEFTEDAIDAIAELAQRANEQMQNIGARRLHTVMESLLEEISFEAPEKGEGKLVIDANYVQEKILPIIKDDDAAKYIL